MGIVLDFCRHYATSARSLKPNTRGSILPAASEKLRKYSEGMAPRAFQFDTAGGPTPASAAAADVPPTASITASTEVSMLLDNSRNVKMSSLHEMAMDSAVDVRFHSGMALKRKIALPEPALATEDPLEEQDEAVRQRVILTRETLLGMNQAELCRTIGIEPNRWNQYETWTAKSPRRITDDIVRKLRRKHGITLDWIYCGDPSGLPRRLSDKLP